ncbi:MAG: FkbM family methyltransferase [Gammaproteobacteria bacterium]|nr:FkbM family methyltransferase [Gammaproteobacteria bacterium]
MSLVRKSRGRLFCVLFNLRAATRGVDARVRFDREAQLFRVRSGGYELSFKHEAQAFYACKRGIAKRTEILGDTYFLGRIDFAPDDVVVDCGANVGELKYYFTLRDLPVEYIGIEPSPLEYRCLERNVAPSATFNVGLWDRDAELEFFVSSQMADSSLIEPPSYDAIVKVPARRLDGLLSHDRIKLLKLEAEGAEPEAIAGCEGILDRIEYVSADLGFERGVEQTSTLAEVTNFLLARNFELIANGRKRLTVLYRNKQIPRR